MAHHLLRKAVSRAQQVVEVFPDGRVIDYA